MYSNHKTPISKANQDLRMKMFLADLRPKKKDRERERERSRVRVATENPSAVQAGINSLGYFFPFT